MVHTRVNKTFECTNCPASSSMCILTAPDHVAKYESIMIKKGTRKASEHWAAPRARRIPRTLTPMVQHCAGGWEAMN